MQPQNHKPPNKKKREHISEDGWGRDGVRSYLSIAETHRHCELLMTGEADINELARHAVSADPAGRPMLQPTGPCPSIYLRLPGNDKPELPSRRRPLHAPPSRPSSRTGPTRQGGGQRPGWVSLGPLPDGLAISPKKRPQSGSGASHLQSAAAVHTVSPRVAQSLPWQHSRLTTRAPD